MRIVPMALALVAAAALASPAAADRNLCPPVAADQWIAIDAAIGKAEALGYSVKKAERSKGCWEIEGHDRNGAEIEIYLHPASGEPVKRRDSR